MNIEQLIRISLALALTGTFTLGICAGLIISIKKQL